MTNEVDYELKLVFGYKLSFQNLHGAFERLPKFK